MTRIRLLTFLPLIAATTSFADSITLRSGTTITGKNVAINAQEVTITRCGATERYARADVQSVDFSTSLPDQACGTPAVKIPELPAGTAVEIRLLDFIDSSHEPPGQTFRGALDQVLTLDGRVIASTGARVVLRMTSVKSDLGQNVQTLELVAIETGKDWSVLKADALPGIEQINGTDAVLKGIQVIAPSKTRVRFTFKSPVRLMRDSS